MHRLGCHGRTRSRLGPPWFGKERLGLNQATHGLVQCQVRIEIRVARFDRLAKLLDQITAEIAAEKTGLENRYRSKSTNAAFLVESMENGSASASRMSEVGELTKSILNCEQRIAELVRQTSRMKELRHSLDAIVDENALAPDSQAEYVKSAGRSG